MEIPAVGELEKEVEHVVAKEVEPRERSLFRVDEPVADHLIESQEKRGEHLLRILSRVRAVTVKHQDILLLDHLERLDDRISLPFAGLCPDERPGIPGIFNGIIRTLAIDDKDMGIPEIPELFYDRANGQALV